MKPGSKEALGVELPKQKLDMQKKPIILNKGFPVCAKLSFDEKFIFIGMGSGQVYKYNLEDKQVEPFCKSRRRLTQPSLAFMTWQRLQMESSSLLWIITQLLGATQRVENW